MCACCCQAHLLCHADVFEFILFVAAKRGMSVPVLAATPENTERAWKALQAYNSRVQETDADRHVPIAEQSSINA